MSREHVLGLGSADDRAYRVAGGPTGAVAVAGGFLGDLSHGGDFMDTTQGKVDGFLAVFSP